MSREMEWKEDPQNGHTKQRMAWHRGNWTVNLWFGQNVISHIWQVVLDNRPFGKITVVETTEAIGPNSRGSGLYWADGVIERYEEMSGQLPHAWAEFFDNTFRRFIEPLPLSVGDVVRLKSGSPKMTIRYVGVDGVTCTWIDDEKRPQACPFPAACLERVPK